MDKLQLEETKLVGEWLFDGEVVVANQTCKRIEWLIDEVLEKAATSDEFGAWETLFRDKDDGRYWEQTYPKSEMHGGGPPSQVCISEAEARKKYRLV